MRFERKALAKVEAAEVRIRRAWSRGDDPPDVSKAGDPIAPIGRITSDGKLEWDEDIVKQIKSFYDKQK